MQTAMQDGRSEVVVRAEEGADTRAFGKVQGHQYIGASITIDVCYGQRNGLAIQRQGERFDEATGAVVGVHHDAVDVVTGEQEIHVQVVIHIGHHGQRTIIIKVHDRLCWPEGAQGIGVLEPLHMVIVEHAEQVQVPIPVDVRREQLRVVGEGEERLCRTELSLYAHGGEQDAGAEGPKCSGGHDRVQGPTRTMRCEGRVPDPPLMLTNVGRTL